MLGEVEQLEKKRADLISVKSELLAGKRSGTWSTSTVIRFQAIDEKLSRVTQALKSARHSRAQDEQESLLMEFYHGAVDLIEQRQFIGDRLQKAVEDFEAKVTSRQPPE